MKAAALFTPLPTWAVVEAVAKEAEEAASRSSQEALHWARVALQIAMRAEGHEGWRKSFRSVAVGAFGNAQRVANARSRGSSAGGHRNRASAVTFPAARRRNKVRAKFLGSACNGHFGAMCEEENASPKKLARILFWQRVSGK